MMENLNQIFMDQNLDYFNAVQNHYQMIGIQSSSQQFACQYPAFFNQQSSCKPSLFTTQSESDQSEKSVHRMCTINDRNGSVQLKQIDKYGDQFLKKESLLRKKSNQYKQAENQMFRADQVEGRPLLQNSFEDGWRRHKKNSFPSDCKKIRRNICEESYSSDSYSKSDKNCQYQQNKKLICQITKQIITYVLHNLDSNNQAISLIKQEIAIQLTKIIDISSKGALKILDQTVKTLTLKLSKFKKTKQQMIKYVFRKIFNSKNKPQSVSELRWRISQKIHQENTGCFKSMNMKYVQKEFQNPIFVELYENFLTNFQINFQKQNEQRIDKLNEILVVSLIKKDINQLKGYKKMPWNKKIKSDIEQLFKTLLQIKKKTIYSQNYEQKLIQQFRNGYTAEYNFLMNGIKKSKIQQSQLQNE